MTAGAPRYGLSLPNRGVLFGATSVEGRGPYGLEVWRLSYPGRSR